MIATKAALKATRQAVQILADKERANEQCQRLLAAHSQTLDREIAIATATSTTFGTLERQFKEKLKRALEKIKPYSYVDEQ